MQILLFFSLVQFLFLICLAICLRNLTKRTLSFQRKFLMLNLKEKTLLHHLFREKGLKIGQLPAPLSFLPSGESQGIVLSVNCMQIPKVKAPYNGSILAKEDGYFLFFRYDSPVLDPKVSYLSHLGMISLRKNFEPIEETFCPIDTKSPFSEDPRAFLHNGVSYLLYNDVSNDCRSLRLASIDCNTGSLKQISSLYHAQESFTKSSSRKTEKNWTSFSSNQELYFLYTIAPREVLKLEKGTLTRVNGSQEKEEISWILPLKWKEKWGKLRGGTPALLVDGQYLSFFHSSFEDEIGAMWYVMGAYTFSSSYPFQIEKISPHPILFQGIYETAHQNTAKPYIYSIYPTGFAIDGNLLHLSCGENDSAIKIVTFDKEKLLASLEEIGKL